MWKCPTWIALIISLALITDLTSRGGFCVFADTILGHWKRGKDHLPKNQNQIKLL